MLKTNQTIQDFNHLITVTANEYSNNSKLYAWDYNKFIDDSGEVKYCMIANKSQATKIIFDESTQCIVTQTIYKSDLDIFNKLRSEL